MDIISALFSEGIDLRQVPGPSTRIDLTGVLFSMVAPAPPPVTVAPHLVVLVREPTEGTGMASLIVEFKDASGEVVARNVQPFTVDPGKFGYRLVRGELEFAEYGTIEAHCRLNENGHVTIVPLTLLPAPA